MNLKTFNAPTLLPTMPGCTPQNPCGVPYNIFMKDLFYMGGGSGSLFDPAYQAVIDYALTQGFTLPSMAVMNIQNTLVIDLKASGIWNDLDVYYNFLTDGDRDFACINWKAPGTFQAVRNGGILFRPFDGFEGNGTNAFLDTGFDLSANGVNYSLNDAGLFNSVAGYALTASNYQFGSAPNFIGGDPVTTLAFLTNGSGRVTINSPIVGTFQILPTYNGMHLLQRKSSTGTFHYFNGAQNGNEILTPSSTIPSGSVVVLAIRNSATPSNFADGIVRTFGIGASLSGKEAALYNDWATYVSSMALVAYSPEYVAILQYAVSQGFAIPSANVRQYQDQLLRSLIGNGIWDELDVYYNFLGDGDINYAKINWKAPGANQLPVGGTYTSLTGLKVSPALSTGFIVGSGKYVLNNASFFSAALQDINLIGAFIVTQPNINFNIFPSGPTFMQLQVNDGTTNNLSGPSLLTEGFFHAQRLDNNRRGFVDGVQVGLHSPPPVAIPANPIVLGVSTNFYQQCFGLGSSLSGKEANLYNVWQTYKYLIQANTIHNAILDYAISQGFALPTYPVRNAARKLIANLLRTGIWDQLDVFYNFVTDGDANYACINWKAPGTFQASPINAPVFTILKGFSNTAALRYINTNWSPSSAGNKMTGANGSLISECFDVLNGFNIVGADDGGVTRYRFSPQAGGLGFFNVNGTAGFVSTTLANYFVHASKEGGRIQSNIDGIRVNDQADAGTTLVSINIFLLASNESGSPAFFVNGGITMFAGGLSLRGSEADLYNSWHAYKINIEQISITF